MMSPFGDGDQRRGSPYVSSPQRAFRRSVLKLIFRTRLRKKTHHVLAGNEKSSSMKAFISSAALFALVSAPYSPSFHAGVAVNAFQFGGKPVTSRLTLGSASTSSSRCGSSRLYESSADADDAVAEADAALKSMPVEEQKEKIGNLVADDEWMGLSMEITELVRTAIIEDVKAKTSDFIGKEEYKVSARFGIGFNGRRVGCQDYYSDVISRTHNLVSILLSLANNCRLEIFQRNWTLASRMRLPTFAAKMNTSWAIFRSHWTK
jgi:hypothetical protein